MISERWNTQTVAVYDYTVRKQMTSDTKPQTKNGVTPISPSQASSFILFTYLSSLKNNESSQQVHIDQTYWAGIGRVRLHLGEDAAQRVLSGASIARICNVWRPLVGPVNNRPIAVADFRSLDWERDFKETLPAPPECRTGESQMIRYHPEQRWYYFSKMATDECLLLKCFDSGSGVRSPHSVSFLD
jgi:hypothetical protein